jgi:2-dehydro-3-deoxyphosphogluconate aldolase/(4S)-4-hydroxy-2-oxoglutarate aldolase
MPTRESITVAVERAGVVAVVRLRDPRTLRQAIDALAEGGVLGIEITMTVPDAIATIAALVPALGDNVLVGAGTVIDPDTARRAVDAGARFIVSPVFRPSILDACHDLEVPMFPGCYTPTEILDAWDAGADIVKVFPATTLGPGYLKDVRAPLPQVKLMPTGGVTPANAGEWIRAGAAAVGIGSALLPAAAIDAADFAQITTLARQAVESVRGARGTRSRQAPDTLSREAR